MSNTDRFDTPPRTCSDIDRDVANPDIEDQGMGAQLLDNGMILELLQGLLHCPFMISHITEWEADELIDRGLFSLEECQITVTGRDFLSTHLTVKAS